MSDRCMEDPCLVGWTGPRCPYALLRNCMAMAINMAIEAGAKEVTLPLPVARKVLDDYDFLERMASMTEKELRIPDRDKKMVQVISKKEEK